MKQTLLLSVLGLALSACSSTPARPDPVPNQPLTPPAASVMADPEIAETVARPAEEPAPKVDDQPEEDPFASEPFLMLDAKAERDEDDFVLVAVGDVSQPSDQWVESTEKNGATAFDPTRELLKSGDLTFMNLENPVTELEPNAKKTYAFTSPPYRLDWYFGAGFNMFSLANNHIADAEQPGIDDTIANLETYAEKNGSPVFHAGAGTTPEEGLAPTYFKPPGKNVTVGFISVGFSRSPNVGRFWDEDLPATITEAQKKADIVVVSVHAGKEYKHVPEADLQQRYRSWVDAGADLVIGHHTHCIQPVETYKEGLILYSLGNFVFASRTVRHRKMNARLYGMLARVVFRDGKIYGAELVPTWVNNSDDWTLESGETLPNANFVPQILTGPFADAWFQDMKGWTQETDATPLERVGDVGFVRTRKDSGPTS